MNPLTHAARILEMNHRLRAVRARGAPITTTRHKPRPEKFWPRILHPTVSAATGLVIRTGMTV